MITYHLWIDSHVHIYNMFCLDKSFDFAIQSFKRECTKFATENYSNDKIKNLFVLCLNEGDKEGSHYRILELSKNITSSQDYWCISQLSSDLFIAKKGVDEIYLYFGRQRVSKEGIELLTLGDSKINTDDRKFSIFELIKRYSNAILVLPWGFGKWIGVRGKLVSDCILDPEFNKELWVGDSRIRPKIWFYVPQFHLAVKKGVPFVAGSDPLPLKGQEQQICLFGNMFEFKTAFEIKIESVNDITSFIKKIRLSAGLKNMKSYQFGGHSGLIDTFTSQIKLRLSK